jgi:hypothetical protein
MKAMKQKRNICYAQIKIRQSQRASSEEHLTGRPKAAIEGGDENGENAKGKIFQGSSGMETT